MKKKLVLPLFLSIFLCILMLLPLSIQSALANTDQYTADKLSIKLAIESEIDIVPSKENYILKTVDAWLSFFPRSDYRQSVSQLTTAPPAQKTENNLNYHWDAPADKTLKLKADAVVNTVNYARNIKNKVAFPVKDNAVPEEIKEYLKESKLIDYKNNAILELATKLAEGEDDLFIVVFKLSNWVTENIEYSLETLTEEADLPASWVLQNRRGICDELTNLFIALCRTIGIPAKFVAGISYTESELFADRWGAHGWAEVYFPGIGWVPFDVTYSQFAHVDPTHIKLKEGYEYDRSSISLEWLGKDVMLVTRDLKFSPEIIEYGKKVPKRITVSNTLFKEEVGFGSYNFIETKIKNLMGNYLAVGLGISKTDKIQVLDKPFRNVALKPNEEKSIFWRFEVSPLLSEENLYTFQFAVYTQFNESDTVMMQSYADAVKLSLNDINENIALLEESTEKRYSKELSFECKAAKNEFYPGEDVVIQCKLKNLGNFNFDGITVCMENICKKAELKIAGEEDITFKVGDIEKGLYETTITAKNSDVFKTSKAHYMVSEFPRITIGGEHFPEKAKFSDFINLKFTLLKGSDAVPKNVKVTLDIEGFKQAWEIDKLTENREFTITIAPYELASVKNNLRIQLEYFDNDGKRYASEKEYTLLLEKPTIGERIRMLVNKINKNPRETGIIVGIAAILSLAIIVIRKIAIGKEYNNRKGL